MSGGQPVAVIGRYALHDEIASGGMATVHFGRLLGPVGFARTVAIKRLHQQFAKDPEFVSMFLDEARLAARIRHPNVVPTLDVVALSGELFLVMDYVHGVSLSRLMRSAAAQGKRIPIEVSATILVGALHGLHAAHEARSERGLPLGIVHRDVSPQNIMIGSDGSPRVLDFGVAKASWRIQTTRDGQVKGKLSYMAPEQVNGGTVGPWTDVYAAGIVFWEALANQRLFKSGDSAAILSRFTKTEPVPAPSVHNAEVTPELDAVVLRALESACELRFPSAHEMADAIEAAAPLASSSAVARWMQSVVHEELATHSALIAEIENGSSVSAPPPGEAPSIRQLMASIADESEIEPSVTRTAATEIQAASEQSSRSQISMTRTPTASEAPGAKRGRSYAWGAAVGALVVAGVLVLVLTRSQTRPEVAPAVPAATLTHTAEPTPAPPEPSTAVAPMAAIAPPPTPSKAASAAGSRPVVSVAPKGIAHAPSSTKPAHPATSCSPPYIVDSRGVRHMKLACFH